MKRKMKKNEYFVEQNICGHESFGDILVIRKQPSFGFPAELTPFGKSKYWFPANILVL